MPDILILNTAGENGRDLLNIIYQTNYSFTQQESLVKGWGLLQQYRFSLLIYIADNLNHSPETVHLDLPEDLIVLVAHLHWTEKNYTSPFAESIFVDFLHPPFFPEKVEHKIQLLLTMARQSEELQRARTEVVDLQKKIGELHRSVDGHNSFLELMSRRDGLTGLNNRRHFSTVIRQLFQRCVANNEDLALLILNIDYFNEINKSCGQDYGDFVLNELAARITSISRDSDICFRLSGEDFAVLMPTTAEDAALQRAEKLRHSCKMKVYDNGHYSRTVTISIGVATLRQNLPDTHEELINMADQALFIAKSEGRNRSLIHTPIERSSFGTSSENFQVLQDTVARILEKTKMSTMRSLQLLTQTLMEGKGNTQIEQAQYFAQLLSNELGFPPTLVETFKNAIILLNSIRYLMHNEMINKQGALSHEEWQVISDFPFKLAQITELFDYFSGERAILLHHGERYDGSGYPDGLKGEEIPIGARIFSLASAVAAMHADRPYRNKLPDEEIIGELCRNAGKQFDPLLVLKLIDIIEEKGILEADAEILAKARNAIKTSFLLTEG